MAYGNLKLFNDLLRSGSEGPAGLLSDVLATKADSLSYISGTYKVEGENILLRVVLWFSYTHCSMCV